MLNQRTNVRHPRSALIHFRIAHRDPESPRVELRCFVETIRFALMALEEFKRDD